MVYEIRLMYWKNLNTYLSITYDVLWYMIFLIMHLKLKIVTIPEFRKGFWNDFLIEKTYIPKVIWKVSDSSFCLRTWYSKNITPKSKFEGKWVQIIRIITLIGYYHCCFLLVLIFWYSFLKTIHVGILF